MIKKNKLTEKEKTNKNINHDFKTKEVVVLVLLTCIISLIMGFFLNSRFKNESNQYSEIIKKNPELQDFIETYSDVIDNYYEKVDKGKIIEDATEGMFSSLDINSRYLNKSKADTFNKQLNGEYRGIGIEIINDIEKNIVIIDVFADTPAFKAGLKKMDIIKSVNGENVQKQETSKLIKKIMEDNGKTIELVVNREGIDKTIKVTKENVVLKSVSSKVFEKNNQKIGYIMISVFANNTVKQFVDNLNSLEKEKIDSLIIDVRGNAGGHLTTVVGILSTLLDDTHVIYQVQTKQDITKFYSMGKDTKEYPLVILSNEVSASASEVLMSALREQLKATIIGQKSFGKGTIQELQSLSSGNSYKMTTKKWLTSKGEWINEKGIEPDIKVDLNKTYYDNPVDELDNQLQSALNFLTS